MATLSNNSLTLADWAKRVDPDGRVPVVAELLSQSNEILEDCVFKEGNLPTGERVVIRTGLPTVYWRALNQGIPSSKSTTAQVDEACGILEARSEVDKDLAMLNGNTAQSVSRVSSTWAACLRMASCLNGSIRRHVAYMFDRRGLRASFSVLRSRKSQ